MSKEAKGPKDTLTVIVGGKEVEVKANENEQISVIIKRALNQADQTGRPAEDWMLRAGEDAGSTLLQPDKKLRDYGLTTAHSLWLNLGSGGGG